MQNWQREAYPFLHCFRNFLFTSPAHFSFYAITSFADSSPTLTLSKIYNADGGRCLVYVDHCGNDILFLYISFSSSWPLSTPRFAFSSLPWYYALSCAIASHATILTASFRRSLVAPLYPAPEGGRSTPALAIFTFGHLSDTRKILSFSFSPGLTIFLFECR